MPWLIIVRQAEMITCVVLRGIHTVLRHSAIRNKADFSPNVDGGDDVLALKSKFGYGRTGQLLQKAKEWVRICVVLVCARWGKIETEKLHLLGATSSTPFELFGPSVSPPALQQKPHKSIPRRGGGKSDRETRATQWGSVGIPCRPTQVISLMFVPHKLSIASHPILINSQT